MKNYANAILNLIDVKKGEKVWVSGAVGAKALLLKLQEEIIRRGAFADMQVYFDESIYIFMRKSTIKQLEPAFEIEKFRAKFCDKRIVVSCDDGSRMRYSKKISYTRLKRVELEADKVCGAELTKIPVVSVDFPTPKMARDAGMDWKEYKDFFFNAVTVDLKSLYNSYRWLEQRINRADEIRILSSNTDIVLNIEGRKCLSDNTITWNLPEGELCTGPVEDGVEGYITFENDQAYQGSPPIKNLSIEFKRGKIVKFKASEGEEIFKAITGTDKGAKRVGELGFGINPALTKFTNNSLFDEKILGTMHIGLGRGFEHTGSLNKSSIHWDLIKDLRPGGKVYIDSGLVFAGGNWQKD